MINVLSEMETLCILVFVSWIYGLGCVLCDGTLSQIPHISSLLYLQDFSCACVWLVLHQDCFHWNLSG